MSIENTVWCQDVLQFWFEELTFKEWFMASDTIDATITSRFATAHTTVSAQSKLPDDATHQWALAAVIVLDQFSRNMFRGTKNAFAFDPLALKLAKQALERNFHQTLTDNEKQFLYMPFMHSENLDDQQTAVDLFTELGKPEHAIEHKVIVEQFGRFPHRNDVLQRESTAAEIDYLKDAKRFGQ